MSASAAAAGAASAALPARTPTGVVAIVPGWNEAKTVGPIIETLKSSPWLDDVVFVDNNSNDGSALVAAKAGARIVHQPVPGKGQAMAAGVDATTGTHLLFVDADLTGFTADHVEQLVRPVVEGTVQQTRGLFDKGGTSWIGRYLGPTVADAYTMGRARVMPVLTGERVVPRASFASLRLSEAGGWNIETSLNRVSRSVNMRTQDSVLHGMSHVEKRDKYENGGLAGRVENFKAIGGTMVARVQHRYARATGALENEPLALDAVKGTYTLDDAALTVARIAQRR